MTRLKDILQQQRRKNFVGRQKEISFFESLVLQAEPSIHLVYIYGPGGQGKTMLLKQFADSCKESSVPYIHLDCRYIESHPDSFRNAFQSASPFSGEKDLIEAIDAQKGNVVLMIDTYEKLKPLDDWLRLEFLPELPGNVITVISARSRLTTNWKTDPGWQSITRVFSLKELEEEESRQLLARRNIPAEQVQRIVSYTHGNPLALCIVADMFDQRKDSRFDPLDSPDIMKTLLEQFVQEVPSPAHKAALELCSLVHITTEKLIEDILSPQMAHELFNWLATLTFIEKGPAGIYPHDMARDAIAMEMHWRNPEWYKHLHIKIQQYFSSRLVKLTGERQRELLFGLIFLHRMNPAVKPFFDFQETGNNWQDKIREEDKKHLVQMVTKFEGQMSAEIFSKWLEHPSADVWVYRDADKIPAGFVLKINLEKVTGKTHDEVTNTLLSYKKELKIADGQLMTVFRSWMSRDHYQNVSGVQSAIFLGIVQWYFTPFLAVSMFSCVHPEFWQQILNYADLHYMPDYDYEINDQHYGWYVHDWRKLTPADWLELMGRKEIGEDSGTAIIEKPNGNTLTEQAFIDAVYEGLKQLKNPKKLINNALLKSKFVLQNNEIEATDINLALALADKLTKTIASLEDSQKDDVMHRVLYRTFINPVGSQEQTADFLYMSFSTYRRQVKKGVERIADILWMDDKKSS